MTGEQLYHRYVGSTTTDRARGYYAQNPAFIEDWERLAAELTETFSRARRIIIDECGRLDPEQPWEFLDGAIAGAPPGIYPCRECGWAQTCGTPPGEDCHS